MMANANQDNEAPVTGMDNLNLVGRDAEQPSTIEEQMRVIWNPQRWTDLKSLDQQLRADRSELRRKMLDVLGRIRGTEIDEKMFIGLTLVIPNKSASKFVREIQDEEDDGEFDGIMGVFEELYDSNANTQRAQDVRSALSRAIVVAWQKAVKEKRLISTIEERYAIPSFSTLNDLKIYLDQPRRLVALDGRLRIDGDFRTAMLGLVRPESPGEDGIERTIKGLTAAIPDQMARNFNPFKRSGEGDARKGSIWELEGLMGLFGELYHPDPVTTRGLREVSDAGLRVIIGTWHDEALQRLKQVAAAEES